MAGPGKLRTVLSDPPTTAPISMCQPGALALGPMSRRRSIVFLILALAAEKPWRRDVIALVWASGRSVTVKAPMTLFRLPYSSDTVRTAV